MAREFHDIIGGPSAEALSDAGMARCTRCNEPEPREELQHGLCTYCGEVVVECPVCLGQAPLAQFGGDRDCGCEGWNDDTQASTVEREVRHG